MPRLGGPGAVAVEAGALVGNKNDYLTLEESARMLGKPVSVLKNALAEGKLGARLAGGRWLIGVRDLEELSRKLPSRPGKAGGSVDASGTPAISERGPRPIVVPSGGSTPVGTGDSARRGKDMEALDSRVRSLAARIEVALAYLGRGHRNAVWDKLRADSYEPNGSLRAALPGGLLGLLDDLKRTKQEYISLRETGRYRRLLRSLPGYDHDRVDNIIEAQQQKRSTASQGARPVGGIDGYGGGNLSKKGYWGGKEGDPPPRTEGASEARLLILRQRARTAARSMRDRGRGNDAREAAAADWAAARREAERLEREPYPVRGRIQEPETERAVFKGRSDTPRIKGGSPAPASPTRPSPPSSASPKPGERRAEGPSGRPSGGDRRNPARQARGATNGYRAKTAHEVSRISRRMSEDGHPAPLGDPASGVVLVVEQPAGSRVLGALELSLRAVGLPKAYVTHASTGMIGEELLAIEPRVLVAVGADAARDIDTAGCPLARQPFSEAEPGVWFSWTKGTAGLLLPSLAPALENEPAKRLFWRAFLTLKTPAPTA